MYQAKTSLLSEIEKALKRWKRGIWLRGLALIGAIAFVGLGSMILLRQQWVHFPWLIPLLFALSLIGIIVVAFQYIFRPLRQQTSIPLAARSIESRFPHLEDRLVTTVEQAGKSDATSRRWLNRLLKDVREKTNNIELNRQLQINGYAAWRTLFVASLIAIGAVLLNSAAWQGDFRAMVKSGFTPPKPPVELEVLPGAAHIKKGAALQVKAILRNYTPESATIFFTQDDTSWQSTQLELNAASGDFNYDFFDVQEPFQYYVKVGGELSDIYGVTVFDAPKIKRIDLTYTYPEYTGLPQRFEPDGGDIWAPVGTSIKISVLAEKPVIAAQLLIGETAAASEMQMLTDSTAAGFLKVEKDSQYSIRLVNKENLDNSPFSEYYIHALPDNPPSILVKRPSKDTKATMLEEVPVVAEIGNDFGLESVQLAITVNTRPEVFAPMQAISSSSSQNTDGTAFQYKDHRALIYLEDINVNIGDFVTYYVKVKDRSQPEETKSDLYFIDIKNFEDIYNVAESQGSGAGMGSGLDLSLSQREIITATTRLKRDMQKINQAEYQDRRDIIKDAQEEVRKTAEQIANMAKMQMNFGGDNNRTMVDELEAAVIDMRDAESFLEQDAIDSSLTAQRDAYTHLVRAEMAINRKQLQSSQSSGGGGARMQDSDELARLFQDELDKLKNKYETLQQGDKSQAQQAVNEAMQKIKELARRQQAINEMSRQLANKNLTEEEKKRQLKKLQRQQEQLRRDTQQAMQQLNESMNRQQQSLNRDVMNELQRASDEMNRASNNMRQQKSQNALSSGQQAQDRLEDIEERLRKSQQNVLRDELQELENKMQQLADRQKRLADSTGARRQRQESADSSGQSKSMQADLNAQNNLRENLQKSMQEMQQLAQGAEENLEVRRGLSQLNRKLQRTGVLDKMQQAEQAMEKGRLDQAERLQRSAHNAMNEGLKQLQRLSKGLEGSKEEKLEAALQEAQKLRDKLENQLQQAQAGDGKQRQQEDSEARTSEQPRRSLDQRDSRIGNPQTLDRRITQEMIEQWREQIWSTKERLEQLQRQIRADSLGYDNYGNRNDLEDLTREAIDDLSGFVRTFTGGDRQRMNEITQKLLDPLRRIEAELQAQIQLRKSQESLRTVREQPIPPEYKDMVEEYYRSLSKTKGLKGQNN